MINIWFISDTHFGHTNILKYEKEARPFASVEEMNEKIIENWNKTVNQKDVVYHLGDFAFGKRNLAIAERLNGRKKLVLGNHDVYDFRLYVHYFERLYGVFQWNRCVLTHVPIHLDHLGHRFWINIHGHLHSKAVQKSFDHEDDPNYFNVSCERHNLTPVHADVILDRLKEVDAAT